VAQAFAGRQGLVFKHREHEDRTEKKILGEISVLSVFKNF
jgi:hypothetical protein